MTTPIENKALATLSQSEIIKLVHTMDDEDMKVVLRYLEEVADTFSLEEIFDIIAYVDTPDVLG